MLHEAHRSVAKDLGSYLMASVPNATIIGFTGTPIAKTHQGEGTFKIFGQDDEQGYLDKYAIRESIEDETNPDEQRQLRAALYRPLVTLEREARTALVDLIVATILR